MSTPSENSESKSASVPVSWTIGIALFILFGTGLTAILIPRTDEKSVRAPVRAMDDRSPYSALPPLKEVLDNTTAKFRNDSTLTEPENEEILKQFKQSAPETDEESDLPLLASDSPIPFLQRYAPKPITPHVAQRVVVEKKNAVVEQIEKELEEEETEIAHFAPDRIEKEVQASMERFGKVPKVEMSRWSDDIPHPKQIIVFSQNDPDSDLVPIIPQYTDENKRKLVPISNVSGKSIF